MECNGGGIWVLRTRKELKTKKNLFDIGRVYTERFEAPNQGFKRPGCRSLVAIITYSTNLSSFSRIIFGIRKLVLRVMDAFR